MVEIIKNRIHLGNKQDYFEIVDKNKNWNYVHIGTELFDKNNYDNATDDYYILENHFYLKWQDLPDLKEFNIKTLETLFDFLDKNKDKNTFIHCDYGQSRSPAITMAYLSKRTEFLPKAFYKSVEVFKKIYPEYFISGGITLFLKKEWYYFN